MTAKMAKSLRLKVGLQFESEEENVVRFVSGLRRDIQDVVELYEYSSQFKNKNEAKRRDSYNGYYSSSWKGKERKHDKQPSKSSQCG